jgi:long-chain acyl-CoA synthetase
MLENLFIQKPKKTFLQTDGKSYSYEWLLSRMSQITGLFKQLNIHTGDRILLAVSDEADMGALFLSSMQNGITIVMADPESKSPRAKSIISKTKPAAIIADKATLDNWQLDPEQIRVITYQKEKAAGSGMLGKFLQKNKTTTSGNNYHSLLENAQKEILVPVNQPGDQIAYIIFTSGTTADSKGVAISYENLKSHLGTLQKVYALNAESNILNTLFLCHADGCIQGPVLSVFAGCTWHKPFRFSLEKIPEFLDYGYANNISHWFVVPAMLHMILPFAENYETSFQYPEFKAMLSVSAHLDAAIWDQFESTFNMQLSNIYGLTETVAGSLFCCPTNHSYKKNSVGRAVDCEIQIVNEIFEEMPIGEVGELCLKGNHIMHQYWDAPETTAASFNNGWFLTGDLASMDEAGFVVIRGRKKNLIISGGINIQPEEVTECLLKLEGVGEATAIGMPDEVFGEKLMAAVVLKAGYNVTGTELIEKSRALLEEKKIPHRIVILEELPKGVSGKVQLDRLKEILLKKQAPVKMTEGPQEAHILNIAAEAFQIPVSRLSFKDTSQTVAGWDSLAHLSFITSLEDHFNIRFNTAEVITMNSIRKAAELIKEKNA